MGKRNKRGRGKDISIVLLIFIVIAAAAAAYAVAPGSSYAEPEAASEGGLTVHYIDVGQGDCSLLVSGDSVMLIDAGEADQAEGVIKYIRDLGITELDYVVATHPHSDHIGGLPKIIDEFPVISFIAPDVTHTTKTFENLLDALERNNKEIIIAKPSDTYPLGDARLTVLSPSKEYNDLNDYSVVLKAVYGNTGFLFTGDAEGEAEDDMLSNGFDLRADVLKVGHHGSRTSTGDSFLSAVSPSVAVISCGADNSYGHPHDTTVKRLLNRDIQIYQTDKNGSIIAKSDGSRIEYETEKE